MTIKLHSPNFVYHEDKINFTNDTQKKATQSHPVLHNHYYETSNAASLMKEV